jgi:isoleucyl-tRNA synthetase
MYQNLVVGPYGKAVPDSVHLCAYPEHDATRIDAALSSSMGAVRELVSLGLKVRTDTKLKVRQPLARAELVLADPQQRAALEAHAGMMAEELNVKEVHFAARADAFVTYKLKPNFAVLGKKLGPKMKSAQAAIGAADAGVLKAALDRDGRAEVIVDGDPLVLTADELQIQVEAKPGFAAASAPVGVVVLDTQLTPDLIAEGWYREVLSRVQATRKDLELDYQARIQIGLAGDAEVLEACRAREAQLKQETLARELVFGDASSGEARELKLEGRTVIVSVAPLSARPASTSGR